MKLTLIASTLILFVAHHAYGDGVILDPIIGTANYDLVPNGSFESGTTLWTPHPGTEATGEFTADASSLSGSLSVLPIPFLPASGPGFAINQDITGLTVGETYVLSGLFNLDGIPEGRFYLDLTEMTTGCKPVGSSVS